MCIERCKHGLREGSAQTYRRNAARRCFPTLPDKLHKRYDKLLDKSFSGLRQTSIVSIFYHKKGAETLNKLEKIELQERKAREKIAAMQAILKQIGEQRTEQENLQIVQQVRALKLSRDELYAFLSGGALPAPLAGAIADADAPQPETVYSRRGMTGHNTPETPEDDTETNHFESEDMNNEE